MYDLKRFLKSVRPSQKVTRQCARLVLRAIYVTGEELRSNYKQKVG
jgi:hypothetical protein